tara:strand:- start:106 stop:774 length:669 start_codon:yes stop_codon:yes gene_type:complete
MIKPIKFLSLFLLLTLFSTYIPNHKTADKSVFLPIKNIEVENAKILNSDIIIKEIESIKGKNLLFINRKTIKDNLDKFDFILNFRVKRIYPDTLKILIFEKKPVAVYLDGKNRFYISEKGTLIKFIELEDFKDLPMVFGKKINFKKIFIELKKVNFPINEIKSFHYFDIGRWDITLKNSKVIKLPTNNYIQKLKNFILISNDKSFDQYKIFDYRVKDQLILN